MNNEEPRPPLLETRLTWTRKCKSYADAEAERLKLERIMRAFGYDWVFSIVDAAQP